MRIAIISDIHGNILALEEVVADIRKRGIDTVINLGDHVAGPLWPKETVQFLMKQNWIQILGNQDRQIIGKDPEGKGLSVRYAFNEINKLEIEWLYTLQPCIKINEKTLAFHGTPTDDEQFLLETIENGRARISTRKEIKLRLGNESAPVMLCGHSHIPRVVEIEGSVLIINPGSVGLQAYEDDLPERHIMETGSPYAHYAILEYDNNSTVEIISVPYDFRKAAEQARKNNRPDWAIALQTGFMC